MTRLSVNINKIATLRNSRGGNNPDLIQVAKDCERFGAQGITVHPRPDERHIRYNDVFELKKIVTTEFNIEGNCQEQKFIDLVLANKPEQVTLVPDVLGQITTFTREGNWPLPLILRRQKWPRAQAWVSMPGMIWIYTTLNILPKMFPVCRK